MRMGHERLSKRIFEGKREEKQRKGIPKKMLIFGFKVAMLNRCLFINDSLKSLLS